MFDEVSTDIREGEVQPLYKPFAAFDSRGEARMREASFRKSCFFVQRRETGTLPLYNKAREIGTENCRESVSSIKR